MAAKKYIEDYPNTVLDIVGFAEEDYEETIQKMVLDGIAVFHGFQEDPRPYYAAAHCVVLPSYHEGMSNVLLEAAATGRALITSDIPGCREAVLEGKSGFICRVENYEDLQYKMEKYISRNYEQRKKMGYAGRERVEKLFDREKVVSQTVQSLEGNYK